MSILRLAALACLCAAAPLVAQKPAAVRRTAPALLSPGPVLSADSERQWIAFDYTPGNQLAFRVTVNGRRAIALLDTGVNFSLVSTGFAAAAGLKSSARAEATAIGGAVPISWAAVESIGFGGLSRDGGRIGIADFGRLVSDTPEPVDVLIGADLIADHAIDIDFDKRRFRMLPSGRMPFAGTTVAMRTGQRSGTFLVDLTIDRARLRPVMIDTGDGGFLSLSNEAWTAAQLSAARPTSTVAIGLGGMIESDLATLPAVGLGSLVARNVEARIERPGGYSAQTAIAGRIGSALLRRYRVLIDPRARRMVLAPGAEIDTVPAKSTSGIVASYERGALRVVHVMKNSPAAATGWKAGERICRIDGTPLPGDYPSSRLATWPIDTPGRTVSLGLCDRGGERQLTLASFY
ncbi:aspartyl protease family protein [Sphingomonas donggukensis]|uniref:Aspartyl protease family protein n=1 Tax=Sphingomonas donggukensis TaxID=2949093 RepID=A0ABY4TVD4_9SPHN|nr:aspartyl protease family protein [Sphingomonas donggukensis]URW75939.1 aspartyl protease family protein [Sphingomonas donggukensis]